MMYIIVVTTKNSSGEERQKFDMGQRIEYEIFGEGSQFSANQKRENTVSSLLIGCNMRPFPENTVLYCIGHILLS